MEVGEREREEWCKCDRFGEDDRLLLILKEVIKEAEEELSRG